MVYREGEERKGRKEGVEAVGGGGGGWGGCPGDGEKRRSCSSRSDPFAKINHNLHAVCHHMAVWHLFKKGLLSKEQRGTKKSLGNSLAPPLLPWFNNPRGGEVRKVKI